MSYSYFPPSEWLSVGQFFNPDKMAKKNLINCEEVLEKYQEG